MSYNYLLTCWGDGPGNLAPVLTAARRLRRNGHQVRVLADLVLRKEVEAAGFRFASWRRPPDLGNLGSDMSNPRAVLERMLFAPAADYANDTRTELERAPTDALLAHSMLLGSAVAAEAAGIPCAMLSPHVSLRPLPGVPPVGSGLRPHARLRSAPRSRPPAAASQRSSTRGCRS
jgi:UDP:flavonoid glycosyltransferase YjiC (YdhE family)